MTSEHAVAAIVMGSVGKLPVMTPAIGILQELGIGKVAGVVSVRTTPKIRPA